MKISPQHASLTGHFPGNPVVPGVVLLDEVTHVLRGHVGVGLRITGMPTLKFLSPLLPAEDFHINVDIDKPGRASFTVMVGERKILIGRATYEDVEQPTPTPSDTGA